MYEKLENALFLVVIILIVIIGYKYAQGVNKIGGALTKMQIEKLEQQALEDKND